MRYARVGVANVLDDPILVPVSATWLALRRDVGEDVRSVVLAA